MKYTINIGKKLQVFWAVLVFASSSALLAQDSLGNTHHALSLKTQFAQLKDEFNYGLVFNGGNIAVGYSLSNVSEQYVFSYTPELSFGVNFNKGIGVAWGFQPIDVFYGYKFFDDKPTFIAAGLYAATNYQWQLYPELQSGHLFWFTSLEVGPQCIVVVPLQSELIKVSITNSAVGWVSRPEFKTETYFYSLSFADFIDNAHNNLTFASANMFNRSTVGVELLPKSGQRLSFAYEFQYFGYYEAPKVSAINHSLNLTWRLGAL